MGGWIVWVSTEKYCNSPKLWEVFASIASGFLIKTPWFSIPVGYVLLLNKLALHFLVMSIMLKLVSKESPVKNCWDSWNTLPVYHTPPPWVNNEELIDPVVFVSKLEVNHCVEVTVLSLYFQLAPFELVGILVYLPVPSSHDCETAKISKFKIEIKFLGSAAVNCTLAVITLVLKVSCPITSSIVVLISLFGNFINILEGCK